MQDVLKHVSDRSSHLTCKRRKKLKIFSVRSVEVIIPPEAATAFMLVLVMNTEHRHRIDKYLFCVYVHDAFVLFTFA